MDLGVALGPMIMGIIIPLAGYRIMFLCLALICFINLNYFQFYVRKKGSGIKILRYLHNPFIVSSIFNMIK